jgi:hypothetical protein
MSKKKITKYEDLVLHVTFLEALLSTVPLSNDGRGGRSTWVDVNGNFNVNHHDSFSPSEALILGRWLVEFYEGISNE